MERLPKAAVAHLKLGDPAELVFRPGPGDTTGRRHRTITLLEGPTGGPPGGLPGGPLWTLMGDAVRLADGSASATLVEVVSPQPPPAPEGTIRRDPVTGLHAMLTGDTDALPWRSARGNGWFAHDEVSTWDVVYTPDDSGVL